MQSVNFGESDLNVYVQNIGDDSVNLDLIFINDDRFIITSENCSVANQQTTKIDKGQTATVTINNSYKTEIFIKAVCKDGTNSDSYWKP